MVKSIPANWVARCAHDVLALEEHLAEGRSSSCFGLGKRGMVVRSGARRPTGFRLHCSRVCSGWGSRRGSHSEVSEGALEDAALETVGGNLL